MKLVFVTAVLCAACGGGGSASTPKTLELERWSTPQPTSYDIFLAARGDVVVMSHRVSRDAGATWQPLDPQLGAPTRVSITNGVIATYASGLVRWDLASNAVTMVTGAPSYATDRTWRVDPITGRFLAYDAVENKIAVESATGWTTGTLPQPAATEVKPYVKDIESNGTTLLTISAWGVHRSFDGGATWQLVTASVPNAGRDLIVHTNRRFILVGGATTYAFSADGAFDPPTRVTTAASSRFAKRILDSSSGNRALAIDQCWPTGMNVSLSATSGPIQRGSFFNESRKPLAIFLPTIEHTWHPVLL